MKIAVCVPHYGDVKAGFLESLANMISATMAARIVFNRVETQPKIRTFLKGSAIIEANRTVLVHQAREWGADTSCFATRT